MACSIPANVATPPLALKNLGNGLGTIRQGAYRTPTSVVEAPTVPSEYLSRQELGIYATKKELNQSGGAESLSAAYGGPQGYRQRPSITNSSLSMPPSVAASVNEYSGTDTINRGLAQTYMQQFSLPPGLNSSMNSNNNSVSYASGLRTNLNNVDYSGTGTIYRRPQLHPGIYERSTLLPNQQDSNLNSSRNSNSQQLMQQQQQQQQKQQQQLQQQQQQMQRANTSGNQGNSSILSNRFVRF